MTAEESKRRRAGGTGPSGARAVQAAEMATGVSEQLQRPFGRPRSPSASAATVCLQVSAPSPNLGRGKGGEVREQGEDAYRLTPLQGGHPLAPYEADSDRCPDH